MQRKFNYFNLLHQNQNDWFNDKGKMRKFEFLILKQHVTRMLMVKLCAVLPMNVPPYLRKSAKRSIYVM